MDSTITHDFPPFFRVHSDGRIERYSGGGAPPPFTPPNDDPSASVKSKDVVVSAGVSVRIFLPKISEKITRLPLLVYVHGGAFCLGSATTPTFHNFISWLVAEANVVAVSVDYRLAPEHLLPIAYDDSWEAFRWVLSHAGGGGSESWLNDHADFQRFYLGGESAGANIANDVAMRAGDSGLMNGVKMVGLILIHPYFGGKEEDKFYKFMCPSSSGCDDDPRLNPMIDPRLRTMPCSRVLFCVAEKDWLKERGWAHYDALRKSSEWGGEVEILETEGEGHGFYLLNPSCEKAGILINWLSSFLNRY